MKDMLGAPTFGDGRLGDQQTSLAIDHRGTTTTVYFHDVLSDALEAELTADLQSGSPPAWLTLPTPLNRLPLLWARGRITIPLRMVIAFLSANLYLRIHRFVAQRTDGPPPDLTLAIDPDAATLPDELAALITAYETEDMDIPSRLPPNTGGLFEPETETETDDILKSPEYQLSFCIMSDGDITDFTFRVDHPRTDNAMR